MILKLGSCEKFHGSLKYHIECDCVSEWCANKDNKRKVYMLEKYATNVTVRLEGLPPFTSYNVTIIAYRQGEREIKKSYGTLRTRPIRASAVQGMSVYCSTNDTVWIRWKEPYPPTGQAESYKIICKDKSSGVANETNFTFYCSLWSNFVCTSISGLESDHIYLVDVSVKNYNVSEYGETRSLAFQIAPKVSSAPENLQIHFKSSDEILLKWDHPLYTYGKLKSFFIQTNNERVEFSTVTSHEKTYNASIPVEFKKKYSFTVWGTTISDGFKASVQGVIVEHDPHPLILWCSKSTTCDLRLSQANRSGLLITHEITGCVEKHTNHLIDPQCVFNDKFIEGLFEQKYCINVTSDEVICIGDTSESNWLLIMLSATLIHAVIVVAFGCLLYKAFMSRLKRTPGYYSVVRRRKNRKNC